MNQIGQDERIDVVGQVGDIYTFDRFSEYDIGLMDSMFHFAKKDKEKEIGLINKVVSDNKKRKVLWSFAFRTQATKSKP